MIDAALESQIRELKLVVFDFDGVFTTNEVFVNQDGVESVVCNRSDGYGFRLLKACDLQTMILSTEQNPVVSARARKLGIECIQGCEDKSARLGEIVRERKLQHREVAFVGNDVNDVLCMRSVGVPVAVGDAFPEAKAAARWQLEARGGKGAVREFCEAVYRARHGIPPGTSPWAHYLRW